MMQQTALNCSTGTIIEERYLVEDVLGTGGFSVVYLVRDLSLGETTEQRFALKELLKYDQSERIRLAFEGDVLKKLNHPALPHVYDVCDQGKDGRAFIVLEYIEGMSLEIVRKQRLSPHYTIPEMVRLMGPVVDAISYLHRQQPPVMHRDIKPANIIVSQKSQQTYLIDFGIAKEYESDATTTAVRHCTPGYGAPEQYGSLGTDLSADIYSLGATCYCLLSGCIPIDALQRMTSLASKKVDPLKPINELVPQIPEYVAEAIQRAMAIDYEQRFACIEDFWSILQNITYEEIATAYKAHKHKPKKHTSSDQQNKKQQHRGILLAPFNSTRLNKLFYIAIAVLIMIFALSTGSYSAINKPALSPARTAQPKDHLSAPTIPPSPTIQTNYMRLSKAYIGTLYNLSTQKTDTMALTNIQQTQRDVSGQFSGLNIHTRFTGVLDNSNHIYLTIPSSTEHMQLFFNGTVRSDGNLVGDYCDQDIAGQCIGNNGLWSVKLNP